MSRTPGIQIRHSRSCGHREGRCNCKPSYEAWVYDKRAGSKIRKTFRNVNEAKSWRRDAGGAVERGTMRTPTKLTLRQFADDWLEKAERREILARTRQPYKPSTLRGYRHDLGAYVYDDVGAMRLSEVRRRDLQAIVDRLVAQGLSGSKVRNVIVAVQAVYRYAKRRDLVNVDPTDELELPESGGRRQRAASPAEAAKLLDALQDDRALWATAFYAGLRRGELRALRCEDINEETTTITVRRGWDDVEGEVEPKSRKGTRTVPIAGTLRLILLEHLARTGRRETNLVFGRTATEPFTPTHIRKRARETWTTAKLEPIGLHEARHTYVTLMHAAGRSLEEIGDYVGHSSTYMTDRYRHLLEGQREQAADALDAYLASATPTVVAVSEPGVRSN